MIIDGDLPVVTEELVSMTKERYIEFLRIETLYRKLRRHILDGYEAFPFELAEKTNDGPIPIKDYDTWVEKLNETNLQPR